MAQELAFALINPYIIAKSRTGGVIARFMNRTRLNLVAARMFGPSQELAERYADLLLTNDDRDPAMNRLLSGYVRRWYAPNPDTGRPHRVMMLLFTGDNAVEKVSSVAGIPNPKWTTGETVRETYGDFVPGADGRPAYFEPAVFIATSAARAAMTLKLWAHYSESDGGLVETGTDVQSDDNIQKTLVLLKPDNFRAASLRVGNIIDLFSRSGLKIIGIRILRMTVEQANNFYGPVRSTLRKRSRAEVLSNLEKTITDVYGITLSEPLLEQFAGEIGDLVGDKRFDQLLHYITGAGAERSAPNTAVAGENCLALVYKGFSAIEKIRHLLGSTDPRQADPGSVRYEFGSDVMANAAHASDSQESAERELKIIDMQGDTLQPWVKQYYGSID